MSKTSMLAEVKLLFKSIIVLIIIVCILNVYRFVEKKATIKRVEDFCNKAMLLKDFSEIETLVDKEVLMNEKHLSRFFVNRYKNKEIKKSEMLVISYFTPLFMKEARCFVYFDENGNIQDTHITYI